MQMQCGRMLRASAQQTRRPAVVCETNACFTSRSSASRTHVLTQAVLTTSAKLPSTHLESSVKALQQLKESAVNRYAMETKNSIIAIGLTIHNAPVELREKLAVPEAEWPRAIEELCSYPHIEEAAVLSTCNRMELYVVAVSWHRGVREVEEWLSRSSGVPLQDLRPYLFLLRDRDATHHLLRVSGGLDSLVMGEGQILAQVRQVYKVGQNTQGFGRQLNGLFKQAITAGKRVRSETSISTGSVSVSSAAVELAQLKLPTHNWSDAKVCIIGAGKMSTLLVKHLLSKGCSQVTILNRSLPRAHALQEEFPDMQMDIHLMPDLMQCVENSDVVFAASGSEELLIHAEDIATMPRRSELVGSVRRFVDISVPRNIAPGITAEQHGGIVYNVDDLKEVVVANKEARAAAAAEAEVLLREEQRSFEAWRDSLETVPTIKALRAKAEAIRATEFEKALSRLGEGMSKKQMKAVEELSKGIVNKLLHGPMTALRCDGTDPDAGCAVTFSMVVVGQSVLGIASAFLYQESGDWGWRVTVLFVLWPATAAMMMVPFILETPNSLIQRGQFEAGRAALQEIRGPSCDDRLMAAEYNSILKASTFVQASHSARSQFMTMTTREQLPPLLLIILIAVFRELCGGHFVSFFLGQILLATSWGTQQQSFLVLQATNALQLIAVVAAIFTIDRWGRRASVLNAAVGCCVGSAGAAVAQHLRRQEVFEDQAGMALVMFIFGISGIYFLLSVELFPLATRSLATSLSTSLAMLFSAVTAVFALRWLCTVHESLAVIYAIGSFLLLVVVALLLPETKLVPLEDVHYLFRDHWVWGWFAHRPQAGCSHHTTSNSSRED
eukprot:gene7044-7258_t